MIGACPHLTVDHDADACECCQRKRRRNQTKRRLTRSDHTSDVGAVHGQAVIETQGSSLYSSVSYWDRRYAKINASQCGHGRNEWFVSFEALESVIVSAFAILSGGPSPRALEVGCGASLLAENIVEHGLSEFVTAIDFSSTCVSLMQGRERDRVGPGSVKYMLMDATRMEEFADSSFDFVLDKGTFDAIVTGDDASPRSRVDADERESEESVRPSNEATRLLSEICRVLSPGGIFILVSHSSDRQDIILKNGFLVVSTEAIANKNSYYHSYTCRMPRNSTGTSH